MNFFNYESKPMQILMMLGDLMILNLLFILCSIPVFTIGAAQTGLYTGLKTLMDPEDDTYCSSAFFKGFKTGFKQVTCAWLVLFALELILGFVVYFLFINKPSGYMTPMCVALFAFAIIALFQSLIPLFHTYFNCTASQLLRNAWYLAVAHPLRSIFVGIVTWVPALILGFDPFGLFMACTPVFFMIYYSGTFLFGLSFTKKPFRTLIDHYNQTHGITNNEAEAEAQTEPAMIEAENEEN